MASAGVPRAEHLECREAEELEQLAEALLVEVGVELVALVGHELRDVERGAAYG